MSRKFFAKKSRGFNMFSAIVAVILIMTGVVLTNTLVTTEEKTGRYVYSLLNVYQLQDAANVARADALQSFNYNFREKLEDYLTIPSDDSTLGENEGIRLFRLKTGEPGSREILFDDVKRIFEDSILLSNPDSNESEKFDKVLRFVAEKTINDFTEGTYGRYRVEVSDNTRTAVDATFNATKSVLVKQNQEGRSFLEVVGCDDSECPLGTFYFNIPLNELSDQEYEKLPQIIVRDLVTNEEIKMAILPKTNLKVYIPLRFFKVLKESARISNIIASANPTLRRAQLGFCDNSCHPNLDPQNPNDVSEWKKPCPDSEASGLVEGIRGNPLGITSYFAYGRQTGEKGLKAYAAKTICDAVTSVDGFKVTIPSDDYDGFGVAVPKPIWDTGDGGAFISRANNCGFYTSRTTVFADLKALFDGTTLSGGVSKKLYCGRIRQAEVGIAFYETNPKYMVKGTYQGAAVKTDLYKIKIIETGFPAYETQEQENNRATTMYPESCHSGRDTCSNVPITT